MPETYKDLFNADSLRKFGADFQSVRSEFPVEQFVATVMDEEWDDLELKGRWQHVTTVLRAYLPPDYAEALAVLDQVVANYSGWDGVYGMVFPYFVEAYGQDKANWDLSMAAMENYTQYASAEFAVRPFIIADEDRMMAQMHTWTQHENEHVRRLASEGCRPALPWGQALKSFKTDPAPVLPILEALKADPSAYVRKSVANNLNDISKTHPELVVQLARDWQGESDHTDWIVKHACRTLLKRSNREALALFGFGDSESVNASHFVLDAPRVAPAISIGDDLEFSFVVQADSDTKVRLEYGIDFVKANGKRNRKVFQISESAMTAGEQRSYTRKHSFADLSTRKHYSGPHSLTLIINGVERGTLDFELID